MKYTKKRSKKRNSTYKKGGDLSATEICNKIINKDSDDEIINLIHQVDNIAANRNAKLLLCAAKNENYNVMRELLRLGVNPNAISYDTSLSTIINKLELEKNNETKLEIISLILASPKLRTTEHDLFRILQKCYKYLSSANYNTTGAHRNSMNNLETIAIDILLNVVNHGTRITRDYAGTISTYAKIIRDHNKYDPTYMKSFLFFYDNYSTSYKLLYLLTKNNIDLDASTVDELMTYNKYKTGY